jgi:hypothetical protein
MATIHSYLRDKVGDVDDATRLFYMVHQLKTKLKDGGESYLRD